MENTRRTPKNKYILSRMDDRSYKVLQLPCGWLIIDLCLPKVGYMLIMHSDYNMRLSTNEVFYQAELINDEGHRWAGLVRFASLDEAMIELMVGPKNIFLDKGTMAWDHEGHCIHWGPAPFHDIDKMHNDFVKAELERRKNPKASFQSGDKVVYRPDGKVYDFGYYGQTGKAIIYNEGERNMQDSFAVDPQELSLR